MRFVYKYLFSLTKIDSRRTKMRLVLQLTYAKSQDYNYNHRGNGFRKVMKSKGYTKELYIDGCKMNVKVDKNNNIIVKGTYKNSKMEFTYFSDGSSEMVTDGKNYDVSINSLSNESVNVSVFDGNKCIKHYTGLN